MPDDPALQPISDDKEEETVEPPPVKLRVPELKDEQKDSVKNPELVAETAQETIVEEKKEPLHIPSKQEIDAKISALKKQRDELLNGKFPLNADGSLPSTDDVMKEIEEDAVKVAAIDEQLEGLQLGELFAQDAKDIKEVQKDATSKEKADKEETPTEASQKWYKTSLKELGVALYAKVEMPVLGAFLLGPQFLALPQIGETVQNLQQGNFSAAIMHGIAAGMLIATSVGFLVAETSGKLSAQNMKDAISAKKEVKQTA